MAASGGRPCVQGGGAAGGLAWVSTAIVGRNLYSQRSRKCGEAPLDAKRVRPTRICNIISVSSLAIAVDRPH